MPIEPSEPPAPSSPHCGCAAWIGGLARDHAGRLAAVARAEGLSPADALDAVQEAFQTLLGRPDMFELRGRPGDAANVLAALVRNAARNARRRAFRALPHVDVDTAAIADAGPPPDELIDLAGATTRLSGCLARLGDVHRHVVTLRVLEEMSGEDAARELGVTPGHVAVLLHRARKQLEACMHEG